MSLLPTTLVVRVVRSVTYVCVRACAQLSSEMTFDLDIRRGGSLDPIYM